MKNGLRSGLLGESGRDRAWGLGRMNRRRLLVPSGRGSGEGCVFWRLAVLGLEKLSFQIGPSPSPPLLSLPWLAATNCPTMWTIRQTCREKVEETPNPPWPIFGIASPSVLPLSMRRYVMDVPKREKAPCHLAPGDRPQPSRYPVPAGSSPGSSPGRLLLRGAYTEPTVSVALVCCCCCKSQRGRVQRDIRRAPAVSRSIAAVVCWERLCRRRYRGRAESRTRPWSNKGRSGQVANVFKCLARKLPN